MSERHIGWVGLALVLLAALTFGGLAEADPLRLRFKWMFHGSTPWMLGLLAVLGTLLGLKARRHAPGVLAVVGGVCFLLFEWWWLHRPG
jgi:hypothetical protein